MTKLLEGKIAIVTGGAKGLGYGISRRLARDGAKVLITGRDGEATAKVAGQIREDIGAEAIGIATDVSVKSEVEAMVQRCVDEFDGIDILVNNASNMGANVLMEHKTDEMIQNTLNVALFGSWWAMKAAFPHFKARGGGSVINFSSIDAQTGAWLHTDYNIAKMGLVGLTRSGAVEWGRFNIRVNCIAPTGLGQVFAELVETVPGFLEAATKNCPLGRAGDPEEDIGPVVSFLASDMSRFVTGEMINVDGGQHLPGYVSIPHNLEELEKSGGQ